MQRKIIIEYHNEEKGLNKKIEQVETNRNEIEDEKRRVAY